MKNYIQSGDVITVRAPVAVASGDFLSFDSIFGFAQASAARFDDVEIVTRGVFRAVVANGDSVTFGTQIYADGDTLTSDADDGEGNAYTRIGVAVSDAVVEDGAAYVKVKIC